MKAYDLEQATYFDLDGVLVDWTLDIFIPAAKDVLQRSINQGEEQHYDLRIQLGLTDEEHERVWRDKRLVKHIRTASPINSIVPDLLQQKHCFITSRSTSSLEVSNAELIREATTMWVRRVLGDDSPIHFVDPWKKAELALGLGITVAYEDNPDTVQQLTDAGIKVKMPVYAYNAQLTQHPLVEALHPWRQSLVA